MISLKSFLRISTFRTLALAALALPGAWAQSVPGVVKMVVPYPAGGGTDLMARSLAQALSAKWGRPVIVDNRGGASGLLGTEFAIKAPGDGMTILFTDASPLVIVPNLTPELVKFKPLTDLAPVALVSRQTPAIVVSSRIPSKNIAEFVEYAKTHPGLPYGTIGVGSYFHIAMEQFQKMAGAKMLHVPYKGTGQIVTDMIGGQVDVALLTLPSVVNFEQEKKVKILAVATEKRSIGRPDIPTVNESGLPGYDVRIWFGLFAPAKTPSGILDKLHDDVAAVVADPAFVQSTLSPQFMAAGNESRSQFEAVIKADNARWADLIKTMGIKAE